MIVAAERSKKSERAAARNGRPAAARREREPPADAGPIAEAAAAAEAASPVLTASGRSVPALAVTVTGHEDLMLVGLAIDGARARRAALVIMPPGY